MLDDAGGLLLDNRRRIARAGGEAGDERRFQLVSDLVRHPQRIDDDPIAIEKFDEIDAAECGRVLVLATAREAQLAALDVERQPRQLILSEGHPEKRAKRIDQRDYQGRGRAEAGACWRI